VGGPHKTLDFSFSSGRVLSMLEIKNYNYSQHIGKLCRHQNDTELFLIIDCFRDIGGNLKYTYYHVNGDYNTSAFVTCFHNKIEFMTPSGIEVIN
jgi:hypothetical protein